MKLEDFRKENNTVLGLLYKNLLEDLGGSVYAVYIDDRLIVGNTIPIRVGNQLNFPEGGHVVVRELKGFESLDISDSQTSYIRIYRGYSYYKIRGSVYTEVISDVFHLETVAEYLNIHFEEGSDTIELLANVLESAPIKWEDGYLVMDTEGWSEEYYVQSVNLLKVNRELFGSVTRYDVDKNKFVE